MPAAATSRPPGSADGKAGYRFGFNGKENDNEVKGEGNQQDYGMRIYDPRMGKFLSVDPLTQSYPWYSPYQFAGNKPIVFIDLDGAEESKPSNSWGPTKPQLSNVKNSFESIGIWNFVQYTPPPKPAPQLPTFLTEYLEWQEMKKFKAEHGPGWTLKILGSLLIMKGVGLGGEAGFTAKSALSYVANRSADAAIDVFAQLVNNKFEVNKLDWIDVATNYIPAIKGEWGELITVAYKNVISASTDYTNEKGLKTVLGDKPLTDAGIEALVGTLVDGLYGEINKNLEGLFKKNGLDDNEIEKRLTEITSKQRDAITAIVKNALIDKSKIKEHK